MAKMGAIAVLVMSITEAEIEEAFEEWRRRYIKNPNHFARGVKKHKTYGATCAAYLLELIHSNQRRAKAKKSKRGR